MDRGPDARQQPPEALCGGISKVNFQETLSSFGDKCPQNGSKTAPPAPRPHLGYPHIGPFVALGEMSRGPSAPAAREQLHKRQVDCPRQLIPAARKQFTSQVAFRIEGVALCSRKMGVRFSVTPQPSLVECWMDSGMNTLLLLQRPHARCSGALLGLSKAPGKNMYQEGCLRLQV